MEETKGDDKSRIDRSLAELGDFDIDHFLGHPLTLEFLFKFGGPKFILVHHQKKAIVYLSTSGLAVNPLSR